MLALAGLLGVFNEMILALKVKPSSLSLSSLTLAKCFGWPPYQALVAVYFSTTLSVNLAALWSVIYWRIAKTGWARATRVMAQQLERLSGPYEAGLVELCRLSTRRQEAQPALFPTPSTEERLDTLEQTERDLVQLWTLLSTSSNGVLAQALQTTWKCRADEPDGTIRQKALTGLDTALVRECSKRPDHRAVGHYFLWLNTLLTSPFSSAFYPPLLRPLDRFHFLGRLSLLLPFFIPYPILVLEWRVHLYLQHIRPHGPYRAPQHLAHSTLQPFFAAFFAYVAANEALYPDNNGDYLEKAVELTLRMGLLRSEVVKAERRLFRAILDVVLASRVYG
ncbi:hypothetical protein JCM8097_007645 [Rhodosporidiobolus ruineniae]